MAQLMRAVKQFRYPSGVKRRPGDTFTAKGRHAMQLAIAGLAVIVEDEGHGSDAHNKGQIREAPLAYETRHMEAKPVSAMTVHELRDHADKRGISLPKGYIAKAALLDIIERA